jgi:hypothetical protein
MILKGEACGSSSLARWVGVSGAVAAGEDRPPPSSTLLSCGQMGDEEDVKPFVWESLEPVEEGAEPQTAAFVKAAGRCVLRGRVRGGKRWVEGRVKAGPQLTPRCVCGAVRCGALRCGGAGRCRARITYPNGDIFEGSFNDAKQKHGSGVYTWSTAEGANPWVPEGGLPEGRAVKYEGSWIEGSRSGIGKMFYPNGDKYHGAREGLGGGVGRFGRWVRGGWALGVAPCEEVGLLFGPAPATAGLWENGKPNGEGSYFYSNGDLYRCVCVCAAVALCVWHVPRGGPGYTARPVLGFSSPPLYDFAFPQRVCPPHPTVHPSVETG